MENWLHVNPSSGSGNGEVEISADLNNGAERTGTIDITGNNSNITRQVEVTQMRGMAGLTISVSFNRSSGAMELRKIKDNTLYTPDTLYTELNTLYGTIQDNTSAVAVTLYAPDNLRASGGIVPMNEQNRSIIPATVFYSHLTPTGGSVSNTINIVAINSEGVSGYTIIHINGTSSNYWTYNEVTPATYVFAVTPSTNTVRLYKNGRSILTASSEWDSFNKLIGYSNSVSTALAFNPGNIYLSYDSGSVVDTHFTLFPLTAAIAESATEIKLAFNHFEFPTYTNISSINARQHIIEWKEGANPQLVSNIGATIYSGT